MAIVACHYVEIYTVSFKKPAIKSVMLIVTSEFSISTVTVKPYSSLFFPT